MKILFVAAEAAPIVKVGGLADVVGSLPKALHAAGHDVRLVIPKYDLIDTAKYAGRVVQVGWPVPWQQHQVSVSLEQAVLPGTRIPVYYLACPEIFHAGDAAAGLRGVYANTPDSAILRQELQRFSFFGQAVATTLAQWGWQPDVVHAHDWHAAGAVVAGKMQSGFPPSVLTIHNLQNQGRWSAQEVLGWLGWDDSSLPVLRRRDADGNLNWMQLGILAADAVNTVSPNYAREILTPEYGEGLEGDLKQRADGIAGILNGLDGSFNPITDTNIAERYDVDSLERKSVNTVALQRAAGLTEDPSQCVLGLVSRLVRQKGIDLVIDLIPRLPGWSAQLVVVGTGSPDLEAATRLAANRAPGRVGLKIGFDAKLAQQVYAGSQIFLMPSRFEPCGLGQMIAMRYGTLPVVRATGGLRDTVTDLSAHPEAGTGFVFEAATSQGLADAARRAIDVCRQPETWSAAARRAMLQDFSWTRSAQAYLRLYDQVKKP